MLPGLIPPGTQIPLDTVAVGGGEEFHQRIGAVGHPGQRLEQGRHETRFDFGQPGQTGRRQHPVDDSQRGDLVLTITALAPA